MDILNRLNSMTVDNCCSRHILIHQKSNMLISENHNLIADKLDVLDTSNSKKNEDWRSLKITIQNGSKMMISTKKIRLHKYLMFSTNQRAQKLKIDALKISICTKTQRWWTENIKMWWAENLKEKMKIDSRSKSQFKNVQRWWYQQNKSDCTNTWCSQQINMHKNWKLTLSRYSYGQGLKDNELKTSK